MSALVPIIFISMVAFPVGLVIDTRYRLDTGFEDENAAVRRILYMKLANGNSRNRH